MVSVRRCEGRERFSPNGPTQEVATGVPRPVVMKDLGMGLGGVEAIPRIDGSGPCSGNPTESSAFHGTGGFARPAKARRERP
jgi:hypothetical protein